MVTRAVIRAAMVMVAMAMLIAACGGSSGQTSVSTPASSAPATSTPSSSTGAAPTKPAKRSRPIPHHKTAVKIVASQYGRILADSRGQALYLFGKESSSQPQCYDDCAVRWPPVIAKGEPAASPGAEGRLLGTTRRRDGRRQLTYAGHPVYYYVGDSPGRVLCQNVNEFGGQWLIIRASGSPVT